MLLLMTTLVLGQGQVFEEKRATIHGLDNVVLRVQSEEQKQHIESIANKIQSKWQLRFNRLEQLKFSEQEGNVIAEGKTETKFLGIFKTQRTLRYNVSGDGEVMQQAKWYDQLYVDEPLDNIQE